jgi:hypothetical protein
MDKEELLDRRSKLKSDLILLDNEEILFVQKNIYKPPLSIRCDYILALENYINEEITKIDQQLKI